MTYPYSPTSKYNEANTVNSPFIMTREYQQHVDALESENFTLRMLLDSLQANLEVYMKSHNSPNDNEIFIQPLPDKSHSNSPEHLNNIDDYIKFQNQLELLLKEEKLDDPDHPETALEVSTLNAQVETLQSKVRELEEENKKLKNSNLDLESKNKELENNNEENEKAIQQLQFENEEFQEANQNNQNQIDELQKQLQDVLDELEQEKENSKAKDMQISELEKKEPSIDFSSIEETVKNYDNALRDNDDLKKENSILQAKNDDLNDQIGKLKQKILDLENELESILGAFEVSDSGDLITKFDTLNQINNELQEQVDDISQENEKLRNELDEMYEKMKAQSGKSRDDTFDVTPISKFNSTFTIDEGDKFSLDNNIISPKRSTTMSAQKKIDQLYAENQKLKGELEELKLQLKELTKSKSSVQTSPFRNSSSSQTKITKSTSPLKNSNLLETKTTINTSPIKTQKAIQKTQFTSPIKPNFHISQPTSTYYQEKLNDSNSSIIHSPKRSFITDLQNKINELTKQNKALEDENLDLHEQLRNRSDGDALVSDSQLSKSSKNSKLSQSSGLNNSTLRNSAFNNMSASAIMSPGEQKLKAENEKLKKSLEEAQRNQSPQKDMELDSLKKENEELRKECDKNSSTLRLRMELINAKKTITQLEAAINQIKINVQKQMKGFYGKMNNFSELVNNKVDSQMKSVKNVQELIPRILMDKSHFPLTNLRKDVVAFIDMTSDMMRDLRDGATACIRATAGLLRSKNRKSLQIPFSGGEKDQIMQLKKKYNLNQYQYENDGNDLFNNNNNSNSPKYKTVNLSKASTASPSYSNQDDSSKRLINTYSSNGSSRGNQNNKFSSGNNSNKFSSGSNSNKFNSGSNTNKLIYHKQIIDDDNDNNNSSFRNAIDKYYNSPKTQNEIQNEKEFKQIHDSSFSDSNQSPNSSIQKKYSFLVNQFQLLINELWKLFGETDKKAPSVLELIRNISSFKEFIQKMIEIIQKKYQIIKKYDDGTIETLSPIVINLIKTVRAQVTTFSQRLHEEHKILLDKIEEESARNMQINMGNLS